MFICSAIYTLEIDEFDWMIRKISLIVYVLWDHRRADFSVDSKIQFEYLPFLSRLSPYNYA